MSTTGFAALYRKMNADPKYQAEKLSVGFLSEVHLRMTAQGITKAELARRAEVSPAYITKLFNGSSNLSLETMSKLALALDCSVSLHLDAGEPKKAVVKQATKAKARPARTARASVT